MSDGERFGTWSGRDRTPVPITVRVRCLLGRHHWRASAAPSGELVLVDCLRCGRGPGVLALHQPDIADIPTRTATSLLRDLHQGVEVSVPVKVDAGEAIAVAATLLQVLAASGKNPLLILDSIAVSWLDFDQDGQA